MDVSTLLAQYKVDLRHARQVADLALALFDAVASRYALPAAQRRLLEIGALLHNVGMTTDPPAHHLVGRDLVLRHAIAPLNRREQTLVACMVVFHRKRVRPELEPAYLALGKKSQREALQLAAILRVADGLDYAQTQTTSLVSVESVANGLRLHLSGPHAASDGARAVTKADLWAKVFGAPLVSAEPSSTAVEESTATLATTATSPLALWYAAPEVPLAELGQVLLRRHLRLLRTAERDVRADEKIEPIHALRVATRRLRALLQLLAPVYCGADGRLYAKALRRLARAASAVRDRDVLLADLQTRTANLGEALAPAVAALTVVLREERRAAHVTLSAYLDDARHTTFVRAFATALNDPANWNDTARVCDLGGSTLWRHYEALRAHDRGGLPTEPEALHAMRLAGKRLRYVLELFTDTLGSHVEAAVKPLVACLDNLGALNDLTVARSRLAPYAAAATTAPAVAAYLALREQEGQHLIGALPARWAELTSADYRHKLLALLAHM
ncbi:MAG: CHAD domain-containing protein [Chloroflexales bacterium]